MWLGNPGTPDTWGRGKLEKEKGLRRNRANKAGQRRRKKEKLKLYPRRYRMLHQKTWTRCCKEKHSASETEQLQMKNIRGKGTVKQRSCKVKLKSSKMHNNKTIYLENRQWSTVTLVSWCLRGLCNRGVGCDWELSTYSISSDKQ